MLASPQSAFPVSVRVLEVHLLLPIKNHGPAVIQRTPDIIVFIPHMLDKFILSREASSHGLARFDRAEKTRLAMDSCDMAIEVRSLSKRTYRAPSDGATEACDVDVGDVFFEGVLVLEESGAGAVWPATCGGTIPRLQQCIFVSCQMKLGPRLVAPRNMLTGRTAATNHSLRKCSSRVIGSRLIMCWFGSRRVSAPV